MKLNHITASALAPLSLVVSLAAHLPTVPVIAAGSALAALSFHGSASAQSGVRVCGIIYTWNGRTHVGWAVKVDKRFAAASCRWLRAIMDSEGIKKPVDDANRNNPGLNLGYRGWHKADFGPTSCEAYTSKIGKTGNMCYEMGEERKVTFRNTRN